MIGSLLSLGRLLGRGLLDLLYPGACWSCGGAVREDDGSGDFCRACRTALTSDDAFTCPRCAAIVPQYRHIDATGACPGCRDETFAFDAAIRLGRYHHASDDAGPAGLLGELVRRCKHAAGEGLAEALGRLWAEHAAHRFEEIGADVIIPIPLHWWRQLRRGYNQSQALAQSLAGALQIPCRPRWLRRVRATPSQQRASPGERKQNLRGAFRTPARLSLAGQTVLLVDDVLTTGSTANEAARALRPAGPARIVVAALARA